MNKWGANSILQRLTSDPRLNAIGDVVLQIKDHSVVKGHRPEDEQNEAYNAVPQRSKLPWPKGKHNAYPSKAQDVQAYPFPPPDTDGGDSAQREEQLYLLGLYKGIAEMMDIPLRTGSDWDRDGEILDNGFDDLFHVEIDGE
ncbi:MAG TPA: hypothetical protein ENH56_19340 [Roseobacter sp.]|nr:hypothetical protein [Roseobacter sp.]